MTIHECEHLVAQYDQLPEVLSTAKLECDGSPKGSKVKDGGSEGENQPGADRMQIAIDCVLATLPASQRDVVAARGMRVRKLKFGRHSKNPCTRDDLKRQAANGQQETLRHEF